MIIEYNVEFIEQEKAEAEEYYFFEAEAGTLDELISFSQTIDINNPDEAGICVYKDDDSGKYVVPFVADGNVAPLNYGEFLNIKSVEEKYWNIEEGRTYITNLGMLAMMSVIA
ncbi:hypothetical protein [Pseudobutyrivibrio xylanivorans]|uniref:Uncharacterized protein n=1 Tax=Pseudobutyrivibrio xylanivorans TaxID=185007 RepID=A0A1G5RUA3_PSEXY|nr:hypothetical protein [Pseudobutyrivibrio xylanivorans]SCZ77290.1 hypothetical protein SAMN02910350_00659 [Pseudobutyrivibrio xylanivorans]